MQLASFSCLRLHIFSLTNISKEIGFEGHVWAWSVTSVGTDQLRVGSIWEHSIRNQERKTRDQKVNYPNFGYLILKYAKKRETNWKTNEEKKRIPGVRFEPTRTIRPLELKSNALTTRPSWCWHIYISSFFCSKQTQAGCSYEEQSIKMAGVISQPHDKDMCTN